LNHQTLKRREMRRRTTPPRLRSAIAAALGSIVAIVLAGCATRPVNPPLARLDTARTYSIERKGKTEAQSQNLVVLAFSGGGTRAAAFSYGVLETLQRTEIVTRTGQQVRLIDQVDVITGVSGGSFTALAYRLYGDRLFGEYEKRFLKRNVQGEIIARTFNPGNWGALWSRGWGRSELAADLYDDILFQGATFGDIQRTDGPFVVVSATDITTGSRLAFVPQNFDVICSDLDSLRLSRAAAASSAVPVVMSPLTINNYGGSCDFHPPSWVGMFQNRADPPRPAARALKRLDELQEFANGEEPYLHLVDGGISDNLGLRGVLDVLELFETLHEAGQKTPLDHVRRIVVFVVNSLSEPATDWAKREEAPGTVPIMIKAAGVPIDRYSGEQVEQLRDTVARWKSLRMVRDSQWLAKNDDPALQMVRNAPDAELYVVDVSFKALDDRKERDFLNQLPTSFVLKDEEVDRLRASAAKIIVASPEFQRLLRDAGARVVEGPVMNR
jgi:NTE family protein